MSDYWISKAGYVEGFWEYDPRVIDPLSDWRPAVVIEPEESPGVDFLTRHLVDALWRAGKQLVPAAEGICPTVVRDALRHYARPAPAKPAEPTGLGAVVKDRNGKPWVRVDHEWWHDGDGDTDLHWDRIDAVEVLSEGVTA